MGVRRAQVDDLEQVLPLFLGYLAFYDQPADRAQAEGFLAAHLADGSATVLVADYEGGPIDTGQGATELAGFALLYPTWDSLRQSRRWILHDLFVAPHARRGGVGRALIDASLDLARSTGATSVSLDTAHDNLLAQALYERSGFERDEEFVAYHHKLS